MIKPASFHQALVRNGFAFFAGVPDSLLRELCGYISDHVPPSDHVITANEGAAVALAAGYHVATGRTPVVYMQNSGFGNTVNPLLSLADPAVYGVPMLLLVGWRGQPGVPDEPQHQAQGHVMEGMLETMNVPYQTVGADSDPDAVVGDIAVAVASSPRPHVLLIEKGTFAPYASSTAAAPGSGMATRTGALDAVLDHLPDGSIVVATTGITSREVYAYRERHGQDHGSDFLTVGSMGHASQIALGVALQQPSRPVICLDGDGAVLMHMGGLAVIGTEAPANYHHVVLNNGAHDSVGGQPTAARHLNLSDIARACGYPRADVVRDVAAVGGTLGEHLVEDGPTFLEVKVASDPNTTAGRPTTSPAENKAALMRTLGIG